MDNDNTETKDIFIKLYIQKYEQLYLELMRKNIEFEINNKFLIKNIDELNLKISELENQIKMQNDILDQAACGLDAANTDKKLLQESVQKLENNLSSKTEEFNRVNNELIKIKSQDSIYRKKAEEFEIEIARQTNELNELYKEVKTLRKRKTVDTA